MSLAQNPLTGQMRQSMANFVTTVYRGQNVIRAKVFMPRNVNSLAQQLHRASFKLIVNAYDSFGGITDEGFLGRPRTYSPFNAFMKANLSIAIDTTGEVPVIDYSKMIVAQGSLPAIEIASAIVSAAGITISYETDLEMPVVKGTDQVVAFVKTVTGKVIISRKPRGAEATNTILISHAGLTAANILGCYVFVLSSDGKKVSNSVYVEVA